MSDTAQRAGLISFKPLKKKDCRGSDSLFYY